MEKMKEGRSALNLPVSLLCHHVLLACLGTMGTWLATGAGALPVFLARRVPDKTINCFLGFAAGVMLAATSFSLILPAIRLGGGGASGAAVALWGILAGALFLDVADRFLPHPNLIQGLSPSGCEHDMRKVWLFTLAVAVHNFPEGLAVGVTFGSGNLTDGLSLAMAVAMQNLPEGLTVALPFAREGFPRRKAFLIALLSGLAEPVGGLFGAGVVHLAVSILPLALAFTAGTMLFAICHEIIPETQKGMASKMATHALVIGFVLMMFLENLMG